MELNQNLLRDFAQITDSKGEEVNSYKEGFVAKVEDGEYHVLLSERYPGEFKGYMADSQALITIVNPFDRFLIMTTNPPKNATTIHYHYVEKNGLWVWERDGYYVPFNNDIWARIFVVDLQPKVVDFVRYIVYEDPTETDPTKKTIYETEFIDDFTVASTYVDCKVGDRVVVQLKNNQAVIISNLSTLLTNKREMDSAVRRIAALEVTIKDHERRIRQLES